MGISLSLFIKILYGRRKNLNTVYTYNKEAKGESVILSDDKRNHLIKLMDRLYIKADHVYAII